jgi:hypothetical protein
VQASGGYGDLMTADRRQLLAFSFPPGSSFEGQLVGALERIESGGAMRILDALFVGRDAGTGELVAVSLSTDGSAGMIGRLLSFRMEESARRRSTERVLESRAGPMVSSLAAPLAPGAAVAAVLVEHTWSFALGESIGRIGGEQTLSEFVDADEIAEVWTHLPATRPA